MIPLRDILPTRRFPLVNWILIGINVVAFLYQMSLMSAVGPHRYEQFLQDWGMVPWTLTTATGIGRFVPVISSMFLHGGFLHLLMNMWFLFIFGDNVEDALGRVRYPLFYLACGAAAAFGQYIVAPGSKVPMIGASGAISGIVGAYLVFYPRAKVVTLIPIFIFLQIIEVPAFLFILLFWFLENLLQGIGALASHSSGGVAFWAHIGGFVAGIVLGPLTRRRDQPLLDPRDYTRPTRRVYYRDWY